MPISSNDANDINTEGNVTAGRDFVGQDMTVHGDQIQGDKVGSNKIADSPITTGDIVGNIGVAIGHGASANVTIQQLDPTDARNQRNHAAMRQLVRMFWIDGVLKHSLYNEVLIRLNLTEQPKAVDNRPWDLILQQPGQPNYSLPAGIPIIDVFDQMNQQLLILGEPGSGKTTMLLELADSLLKRAESDPTHPTPVVFNLSPWSEKRQPLADWLVDELRTRYNIPKKVAQRWIEDGELLPLLDGLDEVKQEYRNACVATINQFRQDHLLPVTICSRVTEYKNLAMQLKLQGAVLVQPLTLTQIDNYLDTAGTNLSAVRAALQKNIELQEIATSPLMLSVMAMAYHGMPVADLSLNHATQSRRQHMFDAYIKRMFDHRGKLHLYPIKKTIHWLSWLASCLRQTEQSMFLIEGLQPSHLSGRLQVLMYILIDRIGWALLFGICLGTIANLTHPDSDWLHYGIVHGVAVGLFGGTFQTEQKKLRRFVIDLMIGAGITLWMLIQSEMIRGILFGRESLFIERKLSSDVTFFVYILLIILTGRPVQIARQIVIIDKLRWSFLKALYAALGFIGIFMGIMIFIFGSLWFLIGMTDGFINALYLMEYGFENTYKDSYEIILVLLSLLSLIVGFAMLGGLESKNIVTAEIPNGGIRRSFYNATFIGLFLGSTVGIVAAGIFTELQNLVMTTIMLGSLSLGLCGWLAFGGYTVLSHLALRLVLMMYYAIPLNYAHFLNYCHDRIFLRKVGGGYIFIHRMLLEHFASLTDKDIERLAADIKTNKSYTIHMY